MLQNLLYGPRFAAPRQLAFTLLILVITWLALTPAPPPGASLGWDKANHFSAFATLLVVGRLAWPRLPGRAMALALFAYGGAIELIQSQLPPREGDWLDLLADCVGIALGLLAFAGLQALMRRRAGP